MSQSTTSRSSKKNVPDELSFPDFDRLLHEPIRLQMISALSFYGSLAFSDLKKLLQTSDGNLSVHARRLEEEEYVKCAKSFENRLPKSEYRLTNTGRKALERYLKQMEALIEALRRR